MFIPGTPLWVDDGTGPVQNPALSSDDFAAGLADLQAKNLDSLWQAAHDYEFARISGTAVGLLAVGVQKGGPVSLAIQAWCNSIWDLYYAHKPSVSHTWDASLVDFSSCGQMPHTIPELMKEVQG